MSKVEKDPCRDVGSESKTATDHGVDALTGSDFTLEEYKMNYNSRGMALIFNQETFLDRPNKTRSGTNFDRDNLEKRFKELNFDVTVHQDLKRVDILAKLKEAALDDHNVNADCFVCVFLSHGEKDKVCAHDEDISIDEVTALFKGDKCRNLVGKPKIFILQACRGREYDPPVTGMAGDSDEEEDQVVADAGVFNTLPAGADFLMCYCVAKGYFSFRDPFYGSWYIQDLCETLKWCGDSLEFTELLTLVNSKMAKRSVEKCRDKELKGKKQIPCFASMLTKKLYFRPKK
ncbi:caspase-6 isoform X2 [Gadus morhua]|uniref:caspase-6 isoform X2 n=1 Tax=Gadus morhua TaxID=8049 RepID=UPI0011B8209E|nr:caspase-6-like isoform X2 [Gadus morhua]